MRINKKHNNIINSVIGDGFCIADNRVDGDGNLLIKGHVRANILVTDVTIDEEGKLDGNVNCTNILIAGILHGNIVALDSVEITSTALVEGDIACKSLKVGYGARLYGTCITNSQSIINDDAKHLEQDIAAVVKLDKHKSQLKAIL